MRWKVNRKTVRGKHLCYWLRKANMMIIDYGNEGGDIHVYKHLMSTDSKNLKSVLDKYVGNNDIASESHLEIKELKDDNSLFRKIFTYQIEQDNNVEKVNDDIGDEKDWEKEYEELENAMAFKVEIPESFRIKDDSEDLGSEKEVGDLERCNPSRKTGSQPLPNSKLPELTPTFDKSLFYNDKLINTSKEKTTEPKAEPKYLCLKLENKLRMGFLTENLWKLITNANKIWKWKDLVEILLLADESSDGTKPKLYNKYQITKIEPEKLPESSKPKCPFCGRNLIWFEQAWICGHGCTKPAIKPNEKGELEKDLNAIGIYPIEDSDGEKEMEKESLDRQTERKECKEKVYCQQCSEFINNTLQGGKAYCKKGFNCYEHAKTLRALYSYEDSRGEKETSHETLNESSVMKVIGRKNSSKLLESKTKLIED